MRSMTGYGRAEYVNDGISLTVELKSVNNRNFDFNCKCPRAFLSFEDLMRKTVQGFISRGRVDLFVSFSDTREKSSSLEVNLEKAQAYYNAGSLIAEKLGLVNDLTVTSLIKSPDVISDNYLTDYSDLEEILKETVVSACESYNKMREIEGERLVSDMLARMDVIENLASQVSKRAPLVVAEYKAKLQARITEALNDVKVDEAKLLNEVAIFTDRANIDEELTRLNSHIKQFRSIISGNGSGKKLDFLMQEFNRETNTICSKSNDITVTQLALEMKNEIEKVREQVQNLE